MAFAFAAAAGLLSSARNFCTSLSCGVIFCCIPVAVWNIRGQSVCSVDRR